MKEIYRTNRAKVKIIGTGRYIAHVLREMRDYFAYTFPNGNMIEGPNLFHFIKQEVRDDRRKYKSLEEMK